MPDTETAYQELFRCFVPNRPGEDPDDHEHDPSLPCDWGWLCSHCDRRVDDQPCPEHAPVAVPGLRLVECQAEPRHWLFAHDRDDYGHGCPWCWYEKDAAELKPLKMAAERRAHRWCWLANPVKRIARRLKLARVRGYTNSHACGHVDVRWRWFR